MYIPIIKSTLIREPNTKVNKVSCKVSAGISLCNHNTACFHVHICGYNTEILDYSLKLKDY